MRDYELMLILDPAADDAVVGRVTERIGQVIAETGGEVGEIERWGKRRLAYDINRLSEGFYLLVQLKAEPTVTSELDRVLSLADEVMRFKLMVKQAA